MKMVNYFFKLYLFLFLLIPSFLVATSNQLQKVFHHTLATDPLNGYSNIELGKLVFYFTHEPVVKKINATTYFIPQANITEQAEQMIAKVTKANQKLYTVAIAKVDKPTPGIEIRFMYDPSRIAISWDTFDAITKAKGLEFRIYNKKLLDTLKKQNAGVLRTTYNKKPTIIIDCGHGGSDTGTIGFFNTKEKEITLAVGKELSSALKKQGFTVCLTRTHDQFIELDERTAIANQCAPNALFISLHANNASKKNVQGVETFCLASNLFTKHDLQLETAIDVMIQSYDDQHYQESRKLAEMIHKNILKTIQQNGYPGHDRKVKEAATQVLMGIKWPGILLEMDFLSNEKAAALLKDPAYQKIMAQGICNGIKEYLNNI